MSGLFLADAQLEFSEAAVSGRLEDLDGVPYYRVDGLESLQPFFMTLVSDTDLWLFISSTGALTAGRRDPDHALFPYTTDDRIHDSRDITGGKTILRIRHEGRVALWEPFSDRYEGLWRIRRSLLKGIHGNRLLFEETNLDLELTFRCEWMMSERWGFVRQVALRNEGDGALSVDILDGIQNVMPSGLGRRFQMEYSTLADGYKRTERLPESGLALFRLSSIPVDKAEPCEALRTNVAWCAGLDVRTRLLSSAQLGAFRKDGALVDEFDVRGQRGAYFVHASIPLPPGGRKEWIIVADVDLDARQVVDLDLALKSRSDLLEEVRQDVARGTLNLKRIVAGADGMQTTADALSCARHFSNTLFNALRGGVPADGMRVSSHDFRSFVGKVNREVAERHATFLEALPDRLDRADLQLRVAGVADPDLARITGLYLPLHFSRRHGDPSRPWNIFSIRVKGENGERIMGYEGNWRDLFQNWEALAQSYPELVEGMIQKFLDASTADGHNPYRVTREGFEWEVVDPHDAWSFIGYWGDHQVIYLLKLLEVSHRFHPGLLSRRLQPRIFTFADVPYRLKSYGEMWQDPRNTIVFDPAAHEAAMARAARIGTDGLLLTGPEGIVRSSLAEKLLLIALSKLWSYIPEAGIWMNTQRPEWNDANNALVGFGVSVVTLAYLRRYVAFCQDRFADCGEATLELGEELAKLLRGIHAVLDAHAAAAEQPVSDGRRRAIMDALGLEGEAYRKQVYRGLSGHRTTVPLPTILAFFTLALRHLDRSLRVNLRKDGLYHAYNLMTATAEGVGIRHLPEMLEGQVAILSSGLLSGPEAADLLDALRASRLHRPDQGSYTLYPDRTLPRFLERNILPPDLVLRSALLSTMLERGDARIVNRDSEGRVHFDAAFSNAEQLERALEALRPTAYQRLVEQEKELVLSLYERVFDHRSFTGRSGTFYKYEGLGCIYWHMVSKLLLEVAEQRLLAGPAEPILAKRLADHYEGIRAGLGIHKSPAVHGAIPIDPYSHTPAFAGAQQPGMTGQVKEDILARIGELGVRVEGGRIAFLPWLVRREEFLDRPGHLESFGLDGQLERVDLDPGTLGFTLCQVPVVLSRSGPPGILVHRRDGTTFAQADLVLDLGTSRSLFQREGEVVRLEVRLALD